MNKINQLSIRIQFENWDFIRLVPLENKQSYCLLEKAQFSECLCTSCSNHSVALVSYWKHQITPHQLKDATPGILQHIMKLQDTLYRKLKTRNLMIQDIQKMLDCDYI